MRALVFLLTILLSACSSTVPLSIQTPPANNINLNQVENDVDSYIGNLVRWGGRIISVSRDSSYTTIEIKHFPLNTHGFPLQNFPSRGKFIGHSSQIFDPEIYQEGLLITFSGTIDSEIKLTTKREDHYLPVITITEAHLWPHSSGENAYTYTGAESQYRMYGYYGSGTFDNTGK